MESVKAVYKETGKNSINENYTIIYNVIYSKDIKSLYIIPKIKNP